MASSLPFSAGREALLSALSNSGTAVIQAPPGTGKTTLTPGYVRDFLADATAAPSKVIVTQPRRIAARAAAERISALEGTQVGRQVGYSVRGDSQVSRDTEIEFVTPGVLLRRLLRDPDMPGVGAVIIDEVHERHIESDLVFGMLAQLRELREDLLLVAMSATVDAQRFATLLGAPIVDVPSPIHPLTIHHVESAESIQGRDVRARPGSAGSVEDYVEKRIVQALKQTGNGGGDVLAFVPTIRATELLADRFDGRDVAGQHIRAFALHGSLTPEQQAAVIAPQRQVPQEPAAAATRRVIIATDVAESSLTVPGVRVVVDSCLSRVARRDSSRGMSLLVTESVSQASTVQRAGRAGREGPGQVFRCVSSEQWSHLPEFSAPSIQTSDLTSAMLDCAVWGAPGGVDLPLPDPLPERPAEAATQTLVQLGALTPPTEDAPFGQVTALGKQLASMPLEPHLARGGLLAAPVVGVDVVARVITVLSDSRIPNSGRICAEVRAVRNRDPVFTRLRSLLSRQSSVSTQTHPNLERLSSLSGDEAIAWTIACCFPQLIARQVVSADGAPTDRVLTVGGTGALLPSSSGSWPSSRSASQAGGFATHWYAIADVARSHTRDGTGARVRCALPLREEVAIAAAGGVEKKRLTTYDRAKKKVRAREVRRVGAIELSSAPAQPTEEESLRAISEALREHGAELLPVSANAEALFKRMHFLHVQGVEGYPDLSGGLPDEVLSFVAADVAKGKKPDVAGLLRGLIPWDKPIDQWAPEHVELPSGRRAKVTYPQVDEAESDANTTAPPVIATKLQDVFGLHESPTIAGVRIQFHLLSPAGRPLAVTDDLASFWAGPYQGVRKDMRGRYPKHSWPESP